MNRTRSSWFLILTLIIILACSSTDPDTLPNRPVFGSASSGNTTNTIPLRVLPAGNVSSESLPLQINVMRVASYPGSDIVIESTLDPGVNYSRYYVSYLSEGLKIYAMMTIPNGQNHPPAGPWSSSIMDIFHQMSTVPQKDMLRT